MAYVTTIDPAELEVTYTELGRKYLMGAKTLNGSSANGVKIAYFTLGDSDIHYGTADKEVEVPALTGELLDCFLGTRTATLRHALIVT